MAALSRASVSGEEDHNKRLLLEAGEELLQQPPSSKEELLEKLDNLEHLLSRMKQVSLASARDALRPAMKALVADGLLRHPDIDVKVSVASCISEIMRITAPDGPYDERRLKDFFELAVLVFGKFSCLHGRCYSKAVSIIVVLAKYRMCVLMWDLKLDALIVQIFQHFLNSIRPDHPDQVFMDMKEIMSMIIKESEEEIPMQLLNILLSSVKKENQNVSPRSYLLGEKVLQENAVKLHTCLPKAVRCLGISTNNFSEVVELIWREAIKSKTTNAEKFLPDNDFKVATSNSTDVISVRSVDTFKMPVNNGSKELSHNATYDGKVGPFVPGSSKLPTNNDAGELATHAAPERVASILDQPRNFLGKNDHKHKDDDVVLVTDITLEESECADAMKQLKSTDSRTTLRPENLGFINAAKKELNPEATQASKKRGWKSSFLNKLEERYDQAWLSGERRSTSRILLKGPAKDTKKISSWLPTCAVSNGLSLSSCEGKTPMMTSIERCQKEKNDKIGQNDGAQFSSISARDSSAAITKKKVSQPSLVASEVFAVVEALEEKHAKDDKKTVPAECRGKKRLASVDESGAECLLSRFMRSLSSFPWDSADKVVREHGEELAGCRVRVWWPLDQVFYEGRITSFDHSEKRHRVIYEDGDEEILNLTKEHWELVKDENTSDPIQEVVPGPSDLSDMRLGCNIDSSRHIRKKKKGNATDRVDVHGYKVQASNAPILAPIFAKYGDIAVNCHNKSPVSRAFFLDVLSDAVRALKTRDVKFSSIKAVKSCL